MIYNCDIQGRVRNFFYIGAMPDSEKYGDIGFDTLGHIAEKQDKFVILNLQKMDITIWKNKRRAPAEKSLGYQMLIKKQSEDENTMIDFWELNYYFIVSL